MTFHQIAPENWIRQDWLKLRSPANGRAATAHSDAEVKCFIQFHNVSCCGAAGESTRENRRDRSNF
jgi:hypothetical protein